MKRGVGHRGIQGLLVLYVIVWSISPPLEIDMIYRLAALGSVGLWMLIALYKGLYVERTHLYAIVFAVTVAFIAFFEKGTLDAVLQQIAIYILVICFIMNCYYEESWEQLTWILPIVFILLIIYNWKTGTALLEDPTIARKLVRADESTYVYLRQGIGGYSLIYPQVCIFPAIAMWIKRAFRHDRRCFVLGMVWLVSYVRCIWNAGYSLALFTSAASLVILLFFRGKDALKAAAFAIVIFIAGLAAIVYVDSFREFLLTQFDGTAVARKIQDLVATQEGGVAEGSIAARIDAYMGSIDAILQYPVIGGLWRGGGGGHSALLDIIAKYGVLGGYIYAKMIFCVPTYYKRKYNHGTTNAMANAVTVSLLFLVILDSFPYSFMPMIVLVLPLLYEYVIQWERIGQ